MSEKSLTIPIEKGISETTDGSFNSDKKKGVSDRILSTQDSVFLALEQPIQVFFNDIKKEISEDVLRVSGRNITNILTSEISNFPIDKKDFEKNIDLIIDELGLLNQQIVDDMKHEKSKDIQYLKRREGLKEFVQGFVGSRYTQELREVVNAFCFSNKSVTLSIKPLESNFDYIFHISNTILSLLSKFYQYLPENLQERRNQNTHTEEEYPGFNLKETIEIFSIFIEVVEHDDNLNKDIFKELVKDFIGMFYTFNSVLSIKSKSIELVDFASITLYQRKSNIRSIINLHKKIIENIFYSSIFGGKISNTLFEKLSSNIELQYFIQSIEDRKEQKETIQFILRHSNIFLGDLFRIDLLHFIASKKYSSEEKEKVEFFLSQIGKKWETLDIIGFLSSGLFTLSYINQLTIPDKIFIVSLMQQSINTDMLKSIDYVDFIKLQSSGDISTIQEILEGKLSYIEVKSIEYELNKISELLPYCSKEASNSLNLILTYYTHDISLSSLILAKNNILKDDDLELILKFKELKTSHEQIGIYYTFFTYFSLTETELQVQFIEEYNFLSGETQKKYSTFLLPSQNKISHNTIQGRLGTYSCFLDENELWEEDFNITLQLFQDSCNDNIQDHENSQNIDDFYSFLNDQQIEQIKHKYPDEISSNIINNIGKQFKFYNIEKYVQFLCNGKVKDINELQNILSLFTFLGTFEIFTFENIDKIFKFCLASDFQIKIDTLRDYFSLFSGIVLKNNGNTKDILDLILRYIKNGDELILEDYLSKKNRFKIKSNNPFDKKLLQIIGELNSTEIEKIVGEVEGFLSSILTKFTTLKTSSTNVRSASIGSGNYTRHFRTIISMLKKEKTEVNIEYLRRIRIINWKNIGMNTDINNNNRLEGIFNFCSHGSKPFFQSLQDFHNDVIETTHTEDFVDIDYVSKYWQEIISDIS